MDCAFLRPAADARRMGPLRSSTPVALTFKDSTTTVPLAGELHARGQEYALGGLTVWVWDAETLVVFKMMFFRRKTSPTWNRS